MTTVLVRYAEIGLKGKNRRDFEHQLMANIQTKLGLAKSNLKLENKQIIVSLTNKSKLNQLKQVFGIAWFAPVQACPSQLPAISKLAGKIAKAEIKSTHTFAVRASRADKQLSFTSQDIAKKVGEVVRKLTKAKVDLSRPDKTIYISASKTQTYIFAQKLPGPGGLPVGSSGKVLSLISGGFDSIAASYLLAKRGASVDFLHFHVFPEAAKVMQTKIKAITHQLSAVTLSQQLFLASYLPFQMAIIDLDNRQEKHELVVFRRLMVRVGEVLAQKHGYQALVLGDSLGQVASQTMENIAAVDQAVDLPIFRPLIGMDKQEIIDLVRKLDLEKTTNLAYKDCCSIISRHPATRANLSKIKQLEAIINLNQITKTIVNHVEIINL